MPVKPIPDGHHTISPSLTCRDCAKAIEFYKKALGAEELARMLGPNGLVMHAELKIGNSIIMMQDEWPQMGCKSPEVFGGSPVAFYVYLENVDAAFKRATDAGVKVMCPPTDMFWGDRMGAFEDPFGHKWTLATHTRDVTMEEMKKGQEEFFKQMAPKK